MRAFNCRELFTHAGEEAKIEGRGGCGGAENGKDVNKADYLLHTRLHRSLLGCPCGRVSPQPCVCGWDEDHNKSTSLHHGVKGFLVKNTPAPFQVCSRSLKT